MLYIIQPADDQQVTIPLFPVNAPPQTLALADVVDLGDFRQAFTPVFPSDFRCWVARSIAQETEVLLLVLRHGRVVETVDDRSNQFYCEGNIYLFSGDNVTTLKMVNRLTRKLSSMFPFYVP